MRTSFSCYIPFSLSRPLASLLCENNDFRYERLVFHSRNLIVTTDDIFTTIDALSLLAVDFTIYVLTSGSWPFTQTAESMILPVELTHAFDSFRAFFVKRHPGRVLKGLFQHSKGELSTGFTKQKYILQVCFEKKVSLRHDPWNQH